MCLIKIQKVLSDTIFKQRQLAAKRKNNTLFFIPTVVGTRGKRLMLL